ncbi:Arginyl-tRNA synthetase [Plasmodium coatneyi]|uniref:Arginyl-tRNA synthetase n=1 Tax=Plasmodium coatneyi TaxID=208452 RepID=A0A1B1DY65_9APIC|nr:Arginyl-tRNA synthetase [Plasmodium coatneyi]ANQ07559.1 Arginyl-tRNA synthetase [Plasmodium coatneyi]
MIRAALLILLFRSCLRCFQLKSTVSNYEHLWNVFFPSVRGRSAYVRGLQPVRCIPPRRAANKAHTKRCRGHATGEVQFTRGDVHAILNNQLQYVTKQILQDENVNLPKHCLLEDNKIFDEYEYQSSVILFLEHSLGKGKDVRSEVLRIFEEADAELIDSLHISPNGILNIRVDDAFVLREFLRFYRDGEVHMGTTPVRGDTSNSPPKTENPQSKEKSTVLLDFCGVNMAKNMHMGHLKSLLLGSALSNIFRSLNYSVKCRSHIGDWNMNLAIVLSFFIMFPDEVISGGKLNGRKALINGGAGKGDTVESYKGFTTPCVASGKMNKHAGVEHPMRTDSTQPVVEEQSQNPLEEEMCMNLLSSLKEENFKKGYEQLDPSKWENINLHNIEFAYKMGKKLFTTSDVFKRISKNSLRMMYQKDEKMIALWDNICRNSKRANKEILDKLKIRKLVDKGESFYVKFVPTILRRLENANVVFQLGGKSCLLLKSKGWGVTNMNSVSGNNVSGNNVSGDNVSGNNVSGDNVSGNNVSGDNVSGNNVSGNPITGGWTANRRKDTHVLSSHEDHYDVMQMTQELLEQIRKNDVDELKKNFTLLTLQNDVAFTYAAIDLAAIHYRVVYEKANKIIYVVDENQRKHFMQIFSIAKFAHILPDDVECICLNYGFVLNSENRKMKTKDLCKENISVKDMLENIKSANPNAHYKNEQTNLNKMHKEGFLLSSLIYSYLSVKNYKRNIITNILNNYHVEYLFIINCYKEVSPILGKVNESDYSSLLGMRKNLLIENNLKKLMLHILHFNHVTQEVTHTYSVDRLCSFLFTLSQKMQPLLQSNFVKKFIPHLESTSVHTFLSMLNCLRKGEVQHQVKSAATIAQKRTKNIIDKMTQTELFLLIKNSGLLDLREDKNLPEQSDKIETFIFNRIFEVLIMQAYLTLVGTTFSMLNLQLVKTG